MLLGKNSETSREHVNVSTLLEESTWFQNHWAEQECSASRGSIVDFFWVRVSYAMKHDEVRTWMTWHGTNKGNPACIARFWLGASNVLSRTMLVCFLFIIMDLSIGWRVNLSMNHYESTNQRHKDVYVHHVRSLGTTIWQNWVTQSAA